MEYLDILDENGNLTGKKKLRNEVHRDGDWHRGVHIWIVTPDKKILIQRRSIKKETYPGLWICSTAGHVKSVQDSVTAAQEEVKEELGIDIPKGNFELIFQYKRQAVYNNGKSKNNCFFDVYLAKADIGINSMKIDKSETEELKLINFLDLENKIKNNDPTFAKRTEEYQWLIKIIHERYY